MPSWPKRCWRNRIGPWTREAHGQGAGQHDGGEGHNQQAGHDQVEGALEQLLAAGELDPPQPQHGHVVEALDRQPAGGHAEHAGGEMEVDGELLQVAIDPLGGLGGDRPTGNQHSMGLVLANGLPNVGTRTDDLRKAGGGRADRAGVVEEPDDLEAEVAGAGHGPAQVAALAARPDDQHAADQGARAAHGPHDPAIDEPGGQHGDGAAGPGGQHPGALGGDLDDEGDEGGRDGAGGDRLEDQLELLGGVEEPAGVIQPGVGEQGQPQQDGQGVEHPDRAQGSDRAAHDHQRLLDALGDHEAEQQGADVAQESAGEQDLADVAFGDARPPLGPAAGGQPDRADGGVNGTGWSWRGALGPVAATGGEHDAGHQQGQAREQADPHGQVAGRLGPERLLGGGRVGVLGVEDVQLGGAGRASVAPGVELVLAGGGAGRDGGLGGEALALARDVQRHRGAVKGGDRRAVGAVVAAEPELLAGLDDAAVGVACGRGAACTSS